MESLVLWDHSDKALAAELELAGHSVVYATSSTRVIEVLKTADIDVLVSSHMVKSFGMPTFVELVRALSPRTVPLILSCRMHAQSMVRMGKDGLCFQCLRLPAAGQDVAAAVALSGLLRHPSIGEPTQPHMRT